MKSKNIQHAASRFCAHSKVYLSTAFAVILLGGRIEAQEAADAKATAETLLSFEGLRPGLCAHIGGTDGGLSAALAAAGNYHVQALTSDPRRVEPLREYLASKDLYGQVVVDHSQLVDLPYPDNLINVLVVENFSTLQKNGLTIDELMRVVAPLNSAIFGNAPADLAEQLGQAGYEDVVIRTKGSWTQVLKPWPEGMDDWQQVDYDEGGASISNDRFVRPVNAAQWVTGFPGLHGNAMSMLLSAGGRIFTFSLDHGIMARDAFNGTEIWKRDGAAILIATDERLFARLEELGPIVALDPATGELLREYSFGGTDKTWPPLSRVTYSDGVLLTGIRDHIEAYDVTSGEKLWHKSIPGELKRGSSKLALFQDINKKRIVGEGRVFVSLPEKKEILCLDLKTGEEVWRTPTEGDRLVCYRQGMLFSQFKEHGTNTKETVFNAAYSAKDGSRLWRYDYVKVWHSGHPHSIMPLNDLVWVLTSVEDPNVDWRKARQAWHALDPKTGKQVRSIPWEKTKHRCYADRATERYLIAGGLDFLDVETGEHHKFLGGRGTCSAGRIAANGLAYGTPNTCQCSTQVRGFSAFTTVDTLPREAGPPLRIAGDGTAADERPAADDWPMHRRDPARSGHTPAVLPAELKPVWSQQLPGRLSPAVVACGKVFVSAIDEHRVVALDLESGEPLWSFRANGRVDSAPTIHAGMALFGCSDGWVYSVSSATGELIWSLRAAPRDRMLMCRGQLESAWPVHGSVLVKDGKVFFAAGRHSDVDGGIWLYAANPANGEILWQRRLTADKLPLTHYGPGNAANDLLVFVGETLFLQKIPFDPETGDITTTRAPFWGGTGGGFLTDNFEKLGGGHELYRSWRMDDIRLSGLSLAYSDDKVFGFGIGLNAGYWNYKRGDALEAFSCSRKVGGKEVYWQLDMPKGTTPRALLPSGRQVLIAIANEEEAQDAGMLMIRDADDGTDLGAMALDFRPTFDGLSAVNGSVIVVGENGQVMRLGKK